MVPPLDNFQGKNKNCSSLGRTISASRRSFFANLTTFERRSGHRSWGDTHLSLGAAQAPPNYDGHLLRTYDFEILTITPIFKSVILRRKNSFSPERRSKVGEFAKNDRLNALIVLVRDEQFSFFPWKWSKGGTIGWFWRTSAQVQAQAQLRLSSIISSLSSPLPVPLRSDNHGCSSYLRV